MHPPPHDFATQFAAPAFSMNGGALVEASAGTGKTYNLQNVFLRLVVTEGLRVQNILAVTFTEAATQELRERLRAILAACETHLTSGHAGAAPPDEALRERLEPILRLPLRNAGNPPQGGTTAASSAVGVAPDPPPPEPAGEALRRVREALRDFDAAAVFTIHGFCNRVLDRYAFECGHDPDAELIPEAGELLAGVCRDAWRRIHYAGTGQSPFQNLGELQRLVAEVAARPDAGLHPAVCPEAGAAAEQVFAAALAEDLRQRPAAEGTNETARALEDRLQALREGAPDGDLSNPLNLRQCAEEVLDAQARRAFWRNPLAGGKPAKIAVDARLPHALPLAADALAALRARMLHTAYGLVLSLHAEVRDRAAITYDAMLLRVRDALRDAASGPRLLRALRGEFHAALVDEFQDTDPIQYEIFRRVFGEGCLPLLLVGDPKQSIYGFRGGDLFTYYAARGHIPPERRHALGVNFRSEAPLVAAVNALFEDAPERDPAFATERIAYRALASRGVPPERRLREEGQDGEDPHPLRIWRYPIANSLPGRDSPVADRMRADVADEIVRLLDDPGCRIGTRRIRPSDIAILTCTHEEARRHREELAARGVQAIRQEQGNVFATSVAQGLALLLQAMLEPGCGRALRAALASGLLPCTLAELRRLLPPEGATATDETTPDAAGGEEADDGEAAGTPRTLEAWAGLFREAGECWRRRSFFEAFRLLADRAGIEAHLARTDEEAPEEALAALQLLVEQTHQEALAARHSPGALFRWFLRQTKPETRADSEEARLRPASDDEAVSLLTVFKSKGLEFPIVFAPTLWRRNPARAVRPETLCVFWHEPQTLAPRLELGRERQEHQIAEALQEDLRLVYVALTRAIHRTYLLAVQGDTPKPTEGTALGRLLARWENGRRTATEDGLSACVHADRPPILVLDRTDTAAPETPPHLRPRARPRIAGPFHDGRAQVNRRHGQASYSSLAPQDAPQPADESARDIDAADETPAAATPDTAPANDLFLFPGGARTGDCWHSLFETLDFQADPETRRRTTDEVLERFHLCTAPTGALRARQRAAVHAMVARVLGATLPGTAPPFALAQVALERRRPEMAFQFPLRRGAQAPPLAACAPILRQRWTGPARDDAFLARLERATQRLPMGFMTGSIDLFFEQEDRFYLLDWKSNRLDGRPESFERAGLAREMAAHAYYLQYLIYAVAAHTFLKQNLRGYAWERHFGGVYYVFLRGVREGSSTGFSAGFFHDRPPEDCLDALAQLWMPEETP